MDTGNTSEIQDKDDQLDEVVETKSKEIESNPQDEQNGSLEFYIDGEGDQKEPKKSKMTQEQSYAAFRKEQEKRKRKNLELENEKSANADLRRELDELKGTVGSIVKGKPPTLEDFNHDEDEYQKAVKSYYEVPQEKKPNKKKEPQQNQSNDEAEYFLFHREQELKKALPQYESDKSDLVETLKGRGVTDPDGVILYLSDLARQKDVDIAKALVVMGKDSSVIEDIERNSQNPFKIVDILDSASKRVKTRSKSKIDTKPEPEINNSGSIDHKSAKVNKLREAWIKNPSQANYNRYKAAK